MRRRPAIGLQVEDEVNVPDMLAEVAVVVIVTMPVTVAFVPVAVSMNVIDANPAPPPLEGVVLAAEG